MTSYQKVLEARNKVTNTRQVYLLSLQLLGSDDPVTDVARKALVSAMESCELAEAQHRENN